MKKSTKRTLKISVVAVLLVAIFAGAFAYFTDYAQNATQSGTAGTVDIGITNGINLLDADGKDILNPGDQRTVEFTVDNAGNKSVDVRTKIVLTSTEAMDTTAAQAEFEIYKASDVELVAGEGYKPVSGAHPVGYIADPVAYASANPGKTIPSRTISADGLTITYWLEDYVLNGAGASDDEREIESDVALDATDFDVNTDGTGATTSYVLVFKGASDNDFQGAGVSIDITVEAKQHRNTSAGWSLVASAGSLVPAAN